MLIGVPIQILPRLAHVNNPFIQKFVMVINDAGKGGCFAVNTPYLIP
jgi:hypothetical protein